MKRNLSLAVGLLLLAACASVQAPAVPTAPPSGVWSGDYGPDPEHRDSVRLDLKWEDTNLRGTVHAGFRDLPLSNVSFRPETGMITMQFDAQGNNGQTVHYLIEGKIDGDAMNGTWSHDGQRGDFRLRKAGGGK